MYLFITKHEIIFYTLFAKINENAKISVFSHLKFIFILFFFMSYRYLYYWHLVLNFPMIYTLKDKYLQCAQMPNLRQRLHYFPADIRIR